MVRHSRSRDAGQDAGGGPVHEIQEQTWPIGALAQQGERVRCIRASSLEPHDLMLEALQDVYVDQMRASQSRLCVKTRAVMP
jgi:hypothetical protein